MSSQNAIIKLNVGGKVFKTTKSTLKKVDGFFRTIVETSVPIGRDEEGCIIVQRNPKHFGLILNYLRYGTIQLPANYYLLKAISEEADFYLLIDLKEICDKKARIIRKTLHFIQRPMNHRFVPGPLSAHQVSASISALIRSCKVQLRRESDSKQAEPLFRPVSYISKYQNSN
uniref:BTB domain-containing protein n=1 Tax=Caenorhabditis tropicalis TaxID=1561998 RepID=A0A1I7TI47_9PELO